MFEKVCLVSDDVFLIFKGRSIWINFISIALECTSLILIIKSFDFLTVFFLDDSFRLCDCVLIRGIFNIIWLNRHHCHVVIGRIWELRYFITNRFKVFFWFVCFVKVNDLSLSHEHQLIKQVKNVWVRLVNCTNDCSSLVCHISENFNDWSCGEWIKSCCWFVQED